MNNSGASWGEKIEDYPDSAFTKLLTLNVQRVFTLTQKLLPLLKKGGKRDGVGRIINVSLCLFLLHTSFTHPSVWQRLIMGIYQIGSINGLSVPGFETYAYSASKAALHQWVTPYQTKPLI